MYCYQRVLDSVLHCLHIQSNPSIGRLCKITRKSQANKSKTSSSALQRQAKKREARICELEEELSKKNAELVEVYLRLQQYQANDGLYAPMSPAVQYQPPAKMRKLDNTFPESIVEASLEDGQV